MPYAPEHYCLGGCGKRIPSGKTYCPECKKRMYPYVRRDPDGGYAKLKKEYNSKRWKDLRAYKLRINPLCEVCAKIPVTTLATVVDHDKPHRGNMDLFYDINNLVSMCVTHHNQKSAEERMDRKKESEG